MQVPTFYDNVPENFLGQKTTASKKLKKKRKKRGRKKRKTRNLTDTQTLGQYYMNQTQTKAWAVATNTLPGLLTQEKNLYFTNRVLTNTIPRNKGEIPNTQQFVNQLAWSQERVNNVNRRLLIDDDEENVRRNLIGAFNAAANNNVAGNNNAAANNNNGGNGGNGGG